MPNCPKKLLGKAGKLERLEEKSRRVKLRDYAPTEDSDRVLLAGLE